jgi:hypothetical protein
MDDAGVESRSGGAGPTTTADDVASGETAR